MNVAVTKLSLLKKAASGGDWKTAVSIASKFPDLGNEKNAIMSAREAYVRPDFQRQLGRDCEALIASGIAALKGKYNV